MRNSAVDLLDVVMDNSTIVHGNAVSNIYSSFQ